jgi:hypothetical protein
MHAFANNAMGITELRLQPRGFFGNARPPCETERSDPVLRGNPSAARVSAATGGCVMCDQLDGAAGTPRTSPGWPSPVAATSPGRRFRQDTNGIQMGHGRSPMGYDRIRTGYESWWDRATAGQVVRRYGRGRVRMSDLTPSCVAHPAYSPVRIGMSALLAGLPTIEWNFRSISFRFFTPPPPINFPSRTSI